MYIVVISRLSNQPVPLFALKTRLALHVFLRGLQRPRDRSSWSLVLASVSTIRCLNVGISVYLSMVCLRSICQLSIGSLCTRSLWANRSTWPPLVENENQSHKNDRQWYCCCYPAHVRLSTIQWSAVIIVLWKTLFFAYRLFSLWHCFSSLWHDRHDSLEMDDWKANGSRKRRT